MKPLLAVLLLFSGIETQTLFEATLFDKSIQNCEETGNTQNLAWSLYYTGRYEDALAQVLNPKDAEEAKLKGVCLLHLGRYQEALDALQHANAPFHLALAHYFLGNYSDAKKLFEIENEPFWQARVEIAQGNYLKAETLLKKQKKCEEKEFLLGLAAFKKGAWPQAVQSFSRSQAPPYIIGVAKLKEGADLQGAKKALMQAWQSSPADAVLLSLAELAAIDGDFSYLEHLDETKVSKQALFEAAKISGNDIFFQHLLKKLPRNDPLFTAALWERGELALIAGNPSLAIRCFEKTSHPSLAAGYALLGTIEGWEKAFALDSGQTAALAAAHLALHKKEWIEKAKNLLQNQKEPFYQKTLAVLHEKLGEKEEAARIYLQLGGSQGLFEAARITEQRELFEKIAREYPNAPFADAAYFKSKSFKQYLQADPLSIEHLRAMPLKYPNSPYLVTVHFLLGLDALKDRNFKRLGKKNELEAIAHFSKCESLYETLAAEEKIPFQPIHTQARHERALAHFQIALRSEGAKKTVYLNEAATLFSPATPEGAFWLARCLLEKGERLQAKQKLLELVNNLQKEKITRGIILFRSFLTLGKISQLEGNSKHALAYFEEAQEAGRMACPSDERLEMLLCKADTLDELGRLDEAMLTLSQAINDPSASSLRIKAMVKRADLYQKQGRGELCRKQLAAAAKFNSPYSQLAKQKMESLHDKSFN